MTKMSERMESKIKAHFDKLFSGVGPSQELYELKEELTFNLREKILDYTNAGMSEDKAFREAVISMGDLSGLVEDMRQVGQNRAKDAVYTSMSQKISSTGIIASILIILFGLMTTLMLHLMDMPNVATFGPLIFVVGGGALLTFSILTRETTKKYGMNKTRATLYGLGVGLLLFAGFVALMTSSATGEAFIAVSSSMIFILAGVGILLSLMFSKYDRRKA